MYAKYAYNADVSQANLLADIVAILTGTTDKATLSTGCDQANTEILAPYDAAGWTLHDDAAGVNAKVIKAPCNGDPNQFKYVEINTNTAGQVFTGLWESWNSTSHVGTNLAFNSKTTGHGQRYSTTTPGTLHISASVGRLVMYGVSAAGNGNALGAASGILEADRGYTWCAVGQGFTPACFWTQNSTIGFTRYRDLSGNTTVGGAVTSILTVPGSQLHTLAANGIGSVGNGAPMAQGFALPLALLACAPSASSAAMVSGFSASGVMAALWTVAGALDETSYDGKTMVLLPSATNGWAKVVVPKG